MHGIAEKGSTGKKNYTSEKENARQSKRKKKTIVREENLTLNIDQKSLAEQQCACKRSIVLSNWRPPYQASYIIMIIGYAISDSEVAPSLSRCRACQHSVWQLVSTCISPCYWPRSEGTVIHLHIWGFVVSDKKMKVQIAELKHGKF